MRRTAPTRDLPHLPPVERVELNESNRKRRLIVAALFLVLGAAALSYSLLLLVGGDSGWRQVEAVTDGLSCAGDFTLYYNVSGASENRDLAAFYGQAAVRAYRLFTGDEEFDGVNNLAAINRHPNQELEVDPALYSAFSLLKEQGRRELFLAPAAQSFAYLFLAGDDANAAQIDPWESEEQAAYYGQIAAFARDPQAVDLELLENNRVRLRLSDAYRSFAEENEIDRFIDFGWMKNAFITDYLADALLQQGYTGGVLASCDGFSRSLSPQGVPYSLTVLHREGDKLSQPAVLHYDGPTAAVCLRDYGLSEEDALRFYRYENGQRRTPYLSLADGRCYAAIDTLTAYSKTLGCARMLLELIPVYVSGSYDSAALLALRETGLEALWCQGETLWYTDPSLAEEGLTLAAESAYRAELAG